MKFMNDYDLIIAQRTFGNDVNGATPNRAKAAATLARLADWTNANSDGWAYWPKPARAGAKLMTLVDPVEVLLTEDATDAELVAALKPVKSFMTRQELLPGERTWILTGRNDG